MSDLTPEVAQQLIGKSFMCIEGQHDKYYTKSQKLQALTKLRAIRFNNERKSEGLPNLVFKREDGTQYEYEAYVFDDLYHR